MRTQRHRDVLSPLDRFFLMVEVAMWAGVAGFFFGVWIAVRIVGVEVTP